LVSHSLHWSVATAVQIPGDRGHCPRGRGKLANLVAAGLVLAQGGEFLFALLALSARGGLVEADVAFFLLSITVVGMALTPVLVRYGPHWISRLLERFAVSERSRADATMAIQHEARENHVVLLGYGRVGQTIARYLRQLSIPYVALDVDATRVAEARTAGEQVFFDDDKQPSASWKPYVSLT
jgi:CPA2 family monovalent cation:H+ antiporter-2